MKKTSLIVILIALALIAVSVLLNAKVRTPIPSAMPSAISASTTPQALETSAPVLADNVTLTVGSNTYRAHISGGESALDVMRIIASMSGFSFSGAEYPSLGFFVESIEGKKSGDGYYWILYINGKSSNLGASSVTVHPGDTLEWRYEKGY